MAAPPYFIAVYSSRMDLLVQDRDMVAPLSYALDREGILFEVDSRYRRDTLDRIVSFSLPDLRIGGAFTRTAAVFAALILPGTILPYGKEKGFLASFPLQHLALQAELPPGFLETMSSWGVRTFGDLAGIDPGALAARLGQRALSLRKLAAGEDEGVPTIWEECPVFREEKEFECPAENTEILLFLLGEMMESLCRRVSASGKAVRGIELVLKGDDGESVIRKIETALPSRNSRLLLSLLRLELENLPLTSGSRSVELEAFSAPTRFVQHSLLEPETLEPEEKGLTLALAEKAWPESSVGIPRVQDSYQPDPAELGGWRESRLLRLGNRGSGLLPEEEDGRADPAPGISLALRRERPPRPLRLMEEEIVSMAGPWKSSGGWWRGRGEDGRWAREEWDLELKGGELLRVFWNPREACWYLEGVYD